MRLIHLLALIVLHMSQASADQTIVIASPEQLVSYYHSISGEDLPTTYDFLSDLMGRKSAYAREASAIFFERNAFSRRDNFEEFRRKFAAVIMSDVPRTIYVPVPVKVSGYNFDTGSFDICCIDNERVGSPGYNFMTFDTKSYRLVWEHDDRKLFRYVPKGIEQAKVIEAQAASQYRWINSYFEFEVVSAVKETDKYDGATYRKVRANLKRVFLTHLKSEQDGSFKPDVVIGMFDWN